MEKNQEHFERPPDNVLQDHDAEKQGILQYRYLVVFMGFLTYVLMNCHILSTSISIVSMVKKHARNSHSNNTISCPQNIENNTKELDSHNTGEFDWSPEIQGYILGASFIGVYITHMPGGLLAENVGAKITLIIGIFVSSISHLLTPSAAYNGKYFMIGIQLLRGMGQGVLPASNFVLAANWIPRNERGVSMTFIMTGLCLGSIIGGTSSGAICDSIALGGWPSAFYTFGGLGIILSIIYLFFIFETPKHDPRISNAELQYILQNQEMDLSKRRPPTPWCKILTCLPFYAMTAAVFGQFWASSHFLSVHPTFLGTILHYPIKENGLFSSVPFVLQTLLTLGASWVSDWLLRNNYLGLNKVRKGCTFISCLGYSVCLLGIFAAGCRKTTSSVFSFLAIGFGGIGSAGCMINPVDLSPTFTGTVMGLCSLVSVSANYIVPILVGYLTNDQQTLEQWNKIFFISIAVVMISGIIFCLFGSAEVQPWNFPSIQDFEASNTKNTNNNEIKAYENTAFQSDAISHL